MSVANTFAFRRLTNPLMVPVATTATQFTVPADFFGPAEDRKYNSFEVTNPNPFWVRLQGTSRRADGQPPTFVPAEENKGWLFPPGYKGVYTTQYPYYMSCLAVTRQGIVPDMTKAAPLEVAYGNGI